MNPQDPIKTMADILFELLETKIGSPFITIALKEANVVIDDTLLPLLEQKLKDAGITITAS